MCQNCLLLFSFAIFVSNNCESNIILDQDIHTRFTRTQSEFSTGLEADIADSVTSGTFLAFEHCQNMFRWDRWNCPKEEFDRQSTEYPNKETAFTQAIIAAGIAHSIIKKCSKGEISDCGCEERTLPILSPPNYDEITHWPSKGTIGSNVLLNKNASDSKIAWSWGGCSDDVTFGARLVHNLLEVSEKNATVVSYVGSHNYRLGTKLIQQTMIKKCRCHGVSGSCSLQTCWMQQGPFQNVATKLKERYRRSKRLAPESIKASIALRNSIKREEKGRDLHYLESVLVFLERSPNYCLPNATRNWPGTRGRSCSRQKSEDTTASERKSCRTLCRRCGYKVKKEKRTVMKRCNCSFQWCCSVNCGVCAEIVDDLYCH